MTNIYKNIVNNAGSQAASENKIMQLAPINSSRGGQLQQPISLNISIEKINKGIVESINNKGSNKEIQLIQAY